MNRKKQNKLTASADSRIIVLLFLATVLFVFCYSVFLRSSLSRGGSQIGKLCWYNDSLVISPCSSTFNNPGLESKSMPLRLGLFWFQPIPVNLADAALLQTISGIGPGLSREIISTRQQKGVFVQPRDLLKVPGIGPGRLQKFTSHLSFVTNP